MPLYTKDKTLVATGYQRIVVGKRGPYVEFTESQIVKENIHIPKNCEYRIKDLRVYYNEYRTNDSAFVKIYEQKKTVAYADYKIGMWYISPSDLCSTFVEVDLLNIL